LNQKPNNMMRRTLLTIAAVGCTFTGTLLAQVSVTTKLPSTVVPGGEFNVELNISKGDVAGFAKLQQDLPTGFTALPGETANSTFSFKDRKVKFLWMALPATADIKVSYKVMVDASVSGNQIIEGNFSYIRNNETEKFVIPNDIIIVTADQAAAAQTDAANKKIEEQKAKEASANTAREAAVAAEESKTVEATDSKPTTDSTPSGNEPSTTSNSAVDNAKIEEQKRAEEAKKAKDEQAAAEAKRSKDAEQAEAKRKADSAKTQDISASKQQPSSSNNELKSKAGLVFRVQILAGPKSVDPSVLASKYNITEAISIEQHDGLNKYIVGEFGSYRPAKTFCNELRDNNNVEGPFVTAYNNGVRIHVKEALDIAGQ
jgi:hypothetical protein